MRPVLVGNRVDALVVAFQVALDEGADDELEERQAFADLAGRSELTLAGLAFSIRRNRSSDRFCFENADARCFVDRRASGGWMLEVVVRAVFLAAHALDVSLALADRIAAGLGETLGARLRRCDLCADFIGFPLRARDAECFVTRAKLSRFRADAKDVDEVERERGSVTREYLSCAGEVNGITIAPGNPIMCRLYDKTVELRLPGREEKLMLERELWGDAVAPGDSVTRVELQLRGEALDQLAMRDPERLASCLDPAWQYFAVEWTRLVQPKTATRLSRCKLDPRWQAVSEVEFVELAKPATRTRVRGGATSNHVLGTVLSRLGASGKLPAVKIPDGDLDDIEPERCAELLREQLQACADAAAQDLFEALVTQYGIHDALVVLREKMNGIRGRFWSIDDETEELGAEFDGTLEAAQ